MPLHCCANLAFGPGRTRAGASGSREFRARSYNPCPVSPYESECLSRFQGCRYRRLAPWRTTLEDSGGARSVVVTLNGRPGVCMAWRGVVFGDAVGGRGLGGLHSRCKAAGPLHSFNRPHLVLLVHPMPLDRGESYDIICDTFLHLG